MRDTTRFLSCATVCHGVELRSRAMAFRSAPCFATSAPTIRRCFVVSRSAAPRPSTAPGRARPGLRPADDGLRGDGVVSSRLRLRARARRGGSRVVSRRFAVSVLREALRGVASGLAHLVRVADDADALVVVLVGVVVVPARRVARPREKHGHHLDVLLRLLHAPHLHRRPARLRPPLLSHGGAHRARAPTIQALGKPAAAVVGRGAECAAVEDSPERRVAAAAARNEDARR